MFCVLVVKNNNLYVNLSILFYLAYNGAIKKSTMRMNDFGLCDSGLAYL